MAWQIKKHGLQKLHGLQNLAFLSHPIWGDFMFSVRFRRRARICRRNDFCFSRQHRFS